MSPKATFMGMRRDLRLHVPPFPLIGSGRAHGPCRARSALWPRPWAPVATLAGVGATGGTWANVAQQAAASLENGVFGAQGGISMHDTRHP